MDKWKYVTRRVRNKPSFFSGERVSSALFKDSNGVSVNKDHDRSKAEIIIDEERLHLLYNQSNIDKNDLEYSLKAIVTVSKTICDELKVLVIDDPLQENIHHALIKKSNEEAKLTSSQARKLALNSKFLVNY